MGTFFVYILKTSFCLALFYLFFRLLLSRETFHRFNRIAVLGILFISLLLPFYEVTVNRPTDVTETVLTIEQLMMLANYLEASDVPAAEVTSFRWVQLLMLVYLVGILFFIGRNIYSLVRMCLLLKSGKRIRMGKGIVLITHTKEALSPFSWMKYIVISEKDMEENGHQILTHELAHIENRHSIDLLFAELCLFFQWFNPAVWLLKQELQNIHEYEADETVIKKGIDAKQYQLLLIKKAVGTRLYSMANSFNHSKLKKRITMMLKEKSSPWARMKYLYILPVAAIAVTAFARPEVSNELKEISELKVSDLIVNVETNVSDTVVVSLEPIDGKKRTTIIENVEVKGDDILVQEEKIMRWESGKLKGETRVKKSSSAPSAVYISEEGNRYIKINSAKVDEAGVLIDSGKKEPLFILEGKEIDGAILSAISPDRIKSISVYKDEKATELYGEKAANGVVVIELLTEEEYQEKAKVNKANSKKNAFNSTLPADVLVLIDGVEGDMNSVAPEDIKSVSVIKKSGDNTKEIEALIDKYGDKAKSGVVFISRKEGGNEEFMLSLKGKLVKVSGVVKDSSGKAIPGVVVLVNGTTKGTITDMDGKFTIQAPDNGKLSIVYIDKKKVEINVDENVEVIMEAE